MRIFLKDLQNNITHEVVNPEQGLVEPTFTMRKKDEDGFASIGFSGDITFYGADYDFLKSILVDDANALDNEVGISFQDDCCNWSNTKNFKIRSDSLKWCANDCSITAAALEENTETEAMKCLRNTLIWDDTKTNWSDNVPFTQRRHPRFAYCNEIRPSWQHDCIIIGAIIFDITAQLSWPALLLLMTSLIPIINIINFINNTFGSNTIPIPADLQNLVSNGGIKPQVWFDEYKDLRNQILDWAIGCGKKHPSPLVRDYAANVCRKCGLTFKSTIFEAGSDYFNSCYHFAPVDKGTKLGDNTTFWIPSNSPNLSGTMFFDQLKGIFHADYNIVNGQLVFERSDFFQQRTPWFDVDNDIEEGEEFKLCFNWVKGQMWAYGNFQYLRDSINTVGSEAHFRWGDHVEWNSPVRPGQKGVYSPVIEFSSCRFRDDHVRMIDGPERDVLTFYENAVLAPAAIKNRIKAHKNVILLNQHVCETPMLLIWDPTFSPIDDARVNPDQFIPSSPAAVVAQFQNNSEATPPGEYYNYPFWFESQMPGNLYDRFFFIEDPRHPLFIGKRKDFDLTISMTCDRLTDMEVDGLDGRINTPEGIARIREIVVNYASKTITFKGQV